MELTTDVLGNARSQALLATLRTLDPRMKAAELMAQCV